MTRVGTCQFRCRHEYQDRVHGVGKRVQNSVKPRVAGALPEWRCTVCKGVNRAEEPRPKPQSETKATKTKAKVKVKAKNRKGK